MLLIINIFAANIDGMNYKIENQLKIIGNNIYIARKMQDLTMQDLAEKAGLCRQTISEVESGNGNISLATYLAVADVVGVSLESDVLPRILQRSRRKVGILDRCRGITKDGVPFRIRTKKGKDYIEFSYDDRDYLIEFKHSDPGMTTRGKKLYLFAASSQVARKIAQIRLKKYKEKLQHDRNLYSQT